MAEGRGGGKGVQIGKVRREEREKWEEGSEGNEGQGEGISRGGRAVRRDKQGRNKQGREGGSVVSTHLLEEFCMARYYVAL